MEFKTRCSAISKIIADPRDKSPAEKIASYRVSVEKKQASYDKLKTKDGAMGTKYISDIKVLEKNIEELLPYRHDVVLSASALTHLKDWRMYNEFGRSKDLETDMTKKGKMGEEKSTTLVNQIYGSMYGYQELVTSKDRKEKRKTDDFKTGECDIYIESHNHIRDIKTSWDASTFPGTLFSKPNLDKNYHDQMQGYLDLWDCDIGFVDYCLIDTPTKLICDKLRKLDWKYGIFSMDGLRPQDEHIATVV